MLSSYKKLDSIFWQKLISIGVPVSLQSMLFSLLGVVDIFMVSQLGESATAAVGVGNRIFFFNLIMIVGASGAMSVLASQYYGANNLDGVRRTLAQTWVLASGLTIPFIIAYMLMPERIVSIIANDPTYISHAGVYLSVTGASIILTALVVPLESALRSTGQAKLPTNVSIVAIVINALLNAILIFGLFGLPALGVLGAAIGTVVSRLIHTLLLFYYTHKHFNYLLPRRQDWVNATDITHRKRFVRVVTPMLIHDSAWAGGILVYNVIIGQLGVSALAIISLLAPVESVLISAFLGFAVAASIILGNEIGAKQYQRVSETSWWYVITSCTFAFMLALLCWLLEPLIHTLLMNSPISDGQLATNVCLIMAFGMVLKVYNMVGIGGVLKSGGDIKYSIFIDLFGQWAIGIPLAYYTGVVLGWPLHFVMLVILLEEIAKMVLTTHRINSKKWINNLVDEPMALRA